VNAPVLFLKDRVRWGQVRQVRVSGQAIGFGFNRDDGIQTVQEQGCQIGFREWPRLRMRMNETQATKARFGLTATLEVWKFGFAGIAHRHRDHMPAPVHEQHHLTVRLERQFSHGSRQFGGQHARGRQFTTVQIREFFDQAGFEAVNVSVDFFDNRILSDRGGFQQHASRSSPEGTNAASRFRLVEDI
jgi:hypothetical protein